MLNQNLEQAFTTFFDEKFDKIFFTLYKRYLKDQSTSHGEQWNEHSELRVVKSDIQPLDSEQLRDFTEEAFTKFYYKKLHTGEIEPSKWEGYVYMIANNLVMDFFRKEKKTRKSVNSSPDARPSDKNLLLSVAESLNMQQVKKFLNIRSDDELEQSGEEILIFLSNLVTYSIGFIPNQKHIASLLLQDENYHHLPFTEAKERMNTRSVSEWYTRGKQAVINQISKAMEEPLEDWVHHPQEKPQQWQMLQQLLGTVNLNYKHLEAQYKQVFGHDLEKKFEVFSSEFEPSLRELLILFNEKKYPHRKLFYKALKHQIETTDTNKLKQVLNKELKLPIDLVRRFFDRQLTLINSALQVGLIANCLKEQQTIREVED